MKTRKEKDRSDMKDVACFDPELAPPACYLEGEDPWLEDLIAQKQRILELQEKLDYLRETLRECRTEWKTAQARLFSIIEEASQRRLPLS